MASIRQAAGLFKTMEKSQCLASVRFYAAKGGKKDAGDKCQKMASTVPPPGNQGKCEKIKVAGCDPRAREACVIIKERVPCSKLEAPFASYSECIKDPTPPMKMTECPRQDNALPERCRLPNEGLSIDGCNPPPPKSLGACKQRKSAPPRKNDCVPKSDNCDPTIKPFKNPK